MSIIVKRPYQVISNEIKVFYPFIYKKKLYKVINKYPLKFRDKIYLGIEGLVILLFPVLIFNRIKLKTELIIDSQVINNLQKLTNYWKRYNPKLELEIQAESEIKTYDKTDYTILAFTGGVDSMFSLTNLDNVDSLLFINGFDIPLKNRILFKKVNNRMKVMTNIIKQDLINASSNLRSVIKIFKKGVTWAYHIHIPAIIFVNYPLKNYYSTLYISNTYTCDVTFIICCDNNVMKYYDSNLLNVINIGEDHTRYEKIKYIADKQPELLPFLRVCWKNPNNKYNCSKCEKCLRTMVLIRKLGLEDQCTSFRNYEKSSKYLTMKKHLSSYILNEIESALSPTS